MVVSHFFLIGLAMVANLTVCASDSLPDEAYRLFKPRLTVLIRANEVFQRDFMPLEPILEVSIGIGAKFMVALKSQTVTIGGEPDKITEIHGLELLVARKTATIPFEGSLLLPNQLLKLPTQWSFSKSITYNDLIRNGFSATQIRLEINPFHMAGSSLWVFY